MRDLVAAVLRVLDTVEYADQLVAFGNPGKVDFQSFSAMETFFELVGQHNFTRISRRHGMHAVSDAYSGSGRIDAIRPARI